MKYIDIHSHINFPDYDEDRRDVIRRLTETDTYTIAVGTDLKSSESAVKLAEECKNIYACIGVHPVDNPSDVFDANEFEKLVKHPKVVAIGECGLDFFHTDKAQDFERQKKLFLEQTYFALKYDKPLMIHSRNAYLELLEILEPLVKEYGRKLRGDVHFFAGNLGMAKRFWAIGFTTSFTGVITFARDYDEVIKNAPLDMLMSETDSPFVTPAPYRGKRNEPSYVSEVVKRISEIRGENLEIIKSALVNNSKRIFDIDSSV